MFVHGLSGNRHQQPHAGNRPLRSDAAGTTKDAAPAAKADRMPILPPPVTPAMMAVKKSKTATRISAAIGYRAARSSIAAG